VSTPRISLGRPRLLAVLIVVLLLAGFLALWGVQRKVWTMSDSSCELSADGSSIATARVKVSNRGLGTLDVKVLQVFAGDPKPGVTFYPTPYFVDRNSVLLPLQSKTFVGTPQGDALRPSQSCRVVGLGF